MFPLVSVIVYGAVHKRVFQSRLDLTLLPSPEGPSACLLLHAYAVGSPHGERGLVIGEWTPPLTYAGGCASLHLGKGKGLDQVLSLNDL